MSISKQHDLHKRRFGRNVGVGLLLVAFIVIYFFVFGAGTFYILKMMNKRPATLKLGLRDGPIRTAGIALAGQGAAGAAGD